MPASCRRLRIAWLLHKNHTRTMVDTLEKEVSFLRSKWPFFLIWPVYLMWHWLLSLKSYHVHYIIIINTPSAHFCQKSMSFEHFLLVHLHARWMWRSRGWRTLDGGGMDTGTCVVPRRTQPSNEHLHLDCWMQKVTQMPSLTSFQFAEIGKKLLLGGTCKEKSH